MASKTYTVEDANRLLPEITGVIERIVELMPTLPEMEEEVRIEQLKNHKAGDTEESREARQWLELFDALGEKLSISPEAAE